MDIESFKKEHARIIESAGGYSAVRKRLSLQKVYASLYFRAKKGIETIEFVPSSMFMEFMYPLDIVTDTGISKLKIPAHSCFELKNSLLSDSVRRISDFARQYKEWHPDAKIYLLYIDKGTLSDKVLNDYKKQKLVEVHQVDDFLAQCDKQAKINTEIEVFERDWRSKRDFIIDDAKFSFRENRCSLFLGAGVSCSAGGPSWEDLLYKSIKRFKKPFYKNDFKKIYRACGMSPIVMGRYIVPDKKQLEKLSDYLQRYVLYKNVDLNRSSLISAICEAIESKNVESVITYNYDDLVETAMTGRGNMTVASVVAKSRNHQDEVPIYHVHGMIPHEKSEIASTPVISERDYHDIYRESFHWSNVEQLHTLDRNSCFFIGLSMTDPNLRRLLDFSHNGSDREIHHYAFLRRESLYGTDDVDKNKKHFETIENQMEELGVYVIWYEAYDEVPQYIRQIIAPMEYIGY